MARRSSDSVLLLHSSAKSNPDSSPHRTRATQVGHTDISNQIATAAKEIGKGTRILIFSLHSYYMLRYVLIPLPPSLPLSISPSFRPHPAVMLWTTDDVCQWMKEIGMEEYTDCMKSHDVGGAKLISLQTSDLTVSVIILQQQSAIMYLISSVCV